DDAAGADDGVLADDDLRENRGTRSDRRPPPDERRFNGPVGLGLQRAAGRRRPRKRVVDERDAVADEHLILDRDAGADERVARDLAAPADRGVTLDLDERSDLRVVADRAAVEIDERG